MGRLSELGYYGLPGVCKRRWLDHQVIYLGRDNFVLEDTACPLGRVAFTDGESVYSIARSVGLCVRLCQSWSEIRDHFAGS